MKRRDFLGSVAAGAMYMSWSRTFGRSFFPRSRSSKNWSWVVPKKGENSDYWKKMLETAKASGIDALIVEFYNGRKAFYDTNRFPVEEDFLSLLLPLCKSTGLELHAWMWTMPCNAEAVVKDHPDWYAVNGKGESAGVKPAYVDYYKFLCPTKEEVQAFIQENVHSLAMIPELDGVHFDYVRLPDVILAPGIQPKYNIVQDREYPQYDYCYCEDCRRAFKAQTGVDPLKDLQDPSANAEWRQFRYDSVTNLVNKKLVPEARKFGKTVSAAVFPNWENVRQEWKKWDLDCFMPMLYNSFYNKGIDWIAESVRKEVHDLKGQKPVYAGLFVPTLSASEIKEAVKQSIQAGGSGITLFELKSVKEDQWSALRSVLGS